PNVYPRHSNLPQTTFKILKLLAFPFPSPLYPRKLTSLRAVVMSAKCQSGLQRSEMIGVLSTKAAFNLHPQRSAMAGLCWHGDLLEIQRLIVRQLLQARHVGQNTRRPRLAQSDNAGSPSCFGSAAPHCKVSMSTAISPSIY